MIRTIAPKDLAGKLLRNFALTTPELPMRNVSRGSLPLKASLEERCLLSQRAKMLAQSQQNPIDLVNVNIPCALVTLPHMTLILLPCRSLAAL